MREYPHDGHQAIDVFLNANKDWAPEQKKSACLHLLDDLAQRLRIASEALSAQMRYDEAKYVAKKLNGGLKRHAYSRNELVILERACREIGFDPKHAMSLLDDADEMWNSLNTTNRLSGYFLDEFITIRGLKCDDVSVPLFFMQLPKSRIDTYTDNAVAQACDETGWEESGLLS